MVSLVIENMRKRRRHRLASEVVAGSEIRVVKRPSDISIAQALNNALNTRILGLAGGP